MSVLSEVSLIKIVQAIHEIWGSQDLTWRPSVGAYVANNNARGQLVLILGTMHNLEVYAIVIQKNDGAIV